MKKFYPILLFLLLACLLNASGVYAQYKVKGTVYDSTRTYPIEFVTVMASSGNGTITNSNGEYMIEVGERDSVWFSYLNKPTIKFPVLKILNPQSFDIAIQVNVPLLKEVKIRQRNYRQDSLQNREDYAKIFDFRKPGLRVAPSQTQYGGAVGFDLNEIINVFRFKRNRSIASFQKRLLQQEQDKFIDHRFSKGLVRRLTGLDSTTTLENFMTIFRPSFEFTQLAGDYDFQKYIKDSYERFKKGLPPWSAFKEEEEQLPPRRIRGF